MLVDFYRACGDVSLPDVQAGLFIETLERVLDGIEDRHPVLIGGDWDRPVVTFGSDGGGTLIALGVPQGEPVYELPPGPVHDQVYEGDARIVADDLPGFLVRNC